LEYLVEANLAEDSETRMSDLELRDNIMIFFIAGHETTSTALSFAITVLAKNPEIQEKLRKEVVAFGNEEMSIENISKLEYLNGFVKENMRIHPPVQLIPTKTSNEDSQLGDWFIPKGARIAVNIYAIHHSKEVYGDPENFRPERWSKESLSTHPIPNSAWIPFSAGARVCIGNNFSLLEQKVFLMDLVKRFKITSLDNVKIGTEKGFGLSGPLKSLMKFESL